MFTYMVRAAIREKERFRTIQITLLAFIALKSWTCQLVTHVENVETPLNLISVFPLNALSQLIITFPTHHGSVRTYKNGGPS